MRVLWWKSQIMTEEAFLSSGGGKYRQLVHRGYGYSILLTSAPQSRTALSCGGRESIGNLLEHRHC